MSRTLAIWRREMRAAFESPIAYVTIILFVASLDGLFFKLGYPIGKVPLPPFWEIGQTTLIVLFTWLPLLLAFLVPALTMGAWLLGKFLAAWTLVVALVTCAVLPVAWSVHSIGDLDWSTVWVGLIGAYMLGAGYVAIALCLSACTEEQLVAFLFGALALGGLWLLRMLVDVVPDFASALEYAAPSTHFLESAAGGVLDLRDAVYFGLLVFFGLFLNTVIVERRRWS